MHVFSGHTAKVRAFIVTKYILFVYEQLNISSVDR